jgi:nucleotidyltransferase substrate binding protein (TIGR01987 family)
MSLNTDHLNQCVTTLERSLELLNNADKNSIEYEVFRNATIKGFELTLETAGKLLRKKLKSYFTIPKEVDDMIFKDILRHANKHGLLTAEEVKQWFKYRDNRNNTAHDYGLGFAEHTLTLLSSFLNDVKNLLLKL